MLRLKKPVSVPLLVFKILLVLLLFSVRPFLSRLFMLEPITILLTEFAIVVIVFLTPRVTEINIPETMKEVKISPKVRAVLAVLSLLLPPIAAQFLPHNNITQLAVVVGSCILVFPAIEPITTAWATDTSKKATTYLYLLIGALFLLYMFLFSVFSF